MATRPVTTTMPPSAPTVAPAWSPWCASAELQSRVVCGHDSKGCSAKCLEQRMLQQHRLQRALPLVHVHVPKTGTSFVNTLLMHHRICPAWPACATLRLGDSDHEFFGAFPRWRLCPAGFSRDYRPPPGHRSAARALMTNNGSSRGVMMMRQPTARLISAHRYGWHTKPNETLGTYAKRARGCAVKILARPTPPEKDNDHICLEYLPPTEGELSLAIEMLRAFAFVGLTERWAESICLFHALFGGCCHAAELVNTRPTQWPPSSEANVSATASSAETAAFYDPWDGALHAVAQELFSQRLAEFGIRAGEPCKYCD